MRCYSLAQEHFGSENGEPPKSLLRDNSLYQARNEALRAVEDQLRTLSDISDDRPDKKYLLIALEDCEECDFRKPSIADDSRGYAQYVREVIGEEV